jgi:hypothetical protein
MDLDPEERSRDFTSGFAFSKILGVNPFMVHILPVVGWFKSSNKVSNGPWQDGMSGRVPMVTITSIWVASLIAILAIVPDYARYQRRVEHLEMLLRTNCAEWSLIKDRSFIPVHQLIASKCLPRKT